jgi:hypothetical protein
MESPQDSGATPLKDGFNFTPMFKGVRVRMRILDSDLALASRRQVATRCSARKPADILGYRTWVTDLDTNLRYDVYGLDCGTPCCHCDAQIFLFQDRL